MVSTEQVYILGIKIYKIGNTIISSINILKFDLNVIKVSFYRVNKRIIYRYMLFTGQRVNY